MIIYIYRLEHHIHRTLSYSSSLSCRLYSAPFGRNLKKIPSWEYFAPWARRLAVGAVSTIQDTGSGIIRFFSESSMVQTRGKLYLASENLSTYMAKAIYLRHFVFVQCVSTFKSSMSKQCRGNVSVLLRRSCSSARFVITLTIAMQYARRIIGKCTSLFASLNGTSLFTSFDQGTTNGQTLPGQ